MAVEIEAKMKVDDLSVVRERLKAAGASPLGEVLEKNLFFDTDDRSLLAADQGLRIRASIDAVGHRENLVTFKGPRQHGPLKRREETEVTVGDFAAAALLLERLGFMRILSFEKRRQSWSFGGCRVELDELPYLGPYVEIEGPKEDTVMRVRETLLLTDRPMVRASYIAMLMTYLQEHGDASREVVFADGKKR